MNREQKDQPLHVSQHSSNEMLAAALSVKEGNNFIAEFMKDVPGWAFQYEKEEYRFYINPWSSKAKTYDDNMKESGFYLVPTCVFSFHSSWEWLMPVVKKIQQLKIDDFSKKKPVMSALIDVDIKILWTAVVDFLKWYAVSER